MKVALLISGYLRTFKNNVDNIEKLILNKFQQVDIYIHITKNEHEDDKYLNPSDVYDDINFIEKKLSPICMLVEDNLKNLSAVSISKINIINNWLKFSKLNHIRQANEAILGEYDLVIKYRPDLNILTETAFDTSIERDVVYIPRDSKIDKGKLRNPNDKFICDALAFGGSNSMNKYFGIYEQLDRLISKFGDVPETLLYHYLHTNRIRYKLLDIDYQIILSKCNVFGIAGDSGSGKTTLGNVLKMFFSNSFMLECDRYHKWERGDENWDNFTHLNPDANYITKMNDDIFNLKVGNSIYQVDYDHKVGKFTEKQLIEPSENTIICGLHSLYDDTDRLYDLKIFIDTDEDLKIKWKIQRDVTERGHTMESVLEQVAKRSEDYMKYIYPQREKSDLIINFIPNDTDTSLKLLISKKYDITKILKELTKKNIQYSLFNEEEKFTTIQFERYQPVRLFESNKIPIFNDFYDYIVFVIFNLNLTL